MPFEPPAIQPLPRVDQEAARIGIAEATVQQLRENARTCPIIHNALRAAEYGMMPLAEALAQAALVSAENARALTDQVVQLRMAMPAPGLIPR